MATKRPYNNSAYGLNEPLINVAQAPIVAKRNPLASDRAELGTTWVNESANTSFVLTSVVDNQATWVETDSGASSITFDGNSGSAVPAAGILNITGGTGITTSASGNTVSIAVTGAEASSFQADSGTAAPSSGVMIMAGAGDVATSASGNTVTFTGSGVQFVDADTGSATASSNTLTVAGTGDITTSATGATITFAGSGVTTVNADAGTAAASSNTITIAGAGTVTTSATGSTVTITGSGGGGGIATLDGDTGSATGATVTIAGGTGITTSATGSTVTITASGGGGGITTLAGNSGSATGSTVTLTTGTSNANGTALFTGSGATMTMTFNNGGNLGLGTGVLATVSGNSNTVVGGSGSGGAITGGNGNTIFGAGSGLGLTSAERSVFIGDNVANGITTGFSNIAIGQSVGQNWSVGTEQSNIVINNNGNSGESNALRIGSSTGADAFGALNKAFICGISGITVTGTAVLVSGTNQLGIAVSSRRFKSDIQDMKEGSTALYKLRPVSFVWDKDSAPGLKDATDLRQYGLIAEEAASVIPHAINLDKEGKPLNINYPDLIGMMINEIQKLRKEVDALKA